MFEGLADKAAEAESTTENTAQSESLETTPAPQQQAQEKAETTTAQQLLDLDKTEKFLFKGKEMTRDELEKAYMRQQDYTKKTQALADERKFIDNLSVDLKAVKSNPALVAEFKKVYPEKYHAYLDVVLDQAAQQQQPQAAVPPEILQRLEQHEQMLTAVQEERQKAEEAKIDAQLETYEQKFTKKYPLADVGSVYHALEAHVRKMRQEDETYGIKNLDEKTIEHFYKQANEYFEKRFNEWNQNKLKNIRDVNERASDIPKGGGIPGEAPRKMSLKDVADHIIGSEFQG